MSEGLLVDRERKGREFGKGGRVRTAAVLPRFAAGQGGVRARQTRVRLHDRWGGAGRSSKLREELGGEETGAGGDIFRRRWILSDAQ